jgi:hypothetical protein
MQKPLLPNIRIVSISTQSLWYQMHAIITTHASFYYRSPNLLMKLILTHARIMPKEITKHLRPQHCQLPWCQPKGSGNGGG